MRPAAIILYLLIGIGYSFGSSRHDENYNIFDHPSIMAIDVTLWPVAVGSLLGRQFPKAAPPAITE